MQRSKKIWQSHRKNKVNRNCPGGSPGLRLNRQDFESTLLNMLKGLRKIKYMELKVTSRTMFHQVENINKEKK